MEPCPCRETAAPKLKLCLEEKSTLGTCGRTGARSAWEATGAAADPGGRGQVRVLPQLPRGSGCRQVCGALCLVLAMSCVLAGPG